MTFVFQKSLPNAKIGFSKAMSAGWLRIDKQAGGPRVFRKVMETLRISWNHRFSAGLLEESHY